MDKEKLHQDFLASGDVAEAVRKKILAAIDFPEMMDEHENPGVVLTGIALAFIHCLTCFCDNVVFAKMSEEDKAEGRRRLSAIIEHWAETGQPALHTEQKEPNEFKWH